MNTGKLRAQVVSIDQISELERTRMFHLMQTYYEGLSVEGFQRDLEKKTAVILLRDSGTRLIKGFSTILEQRLNLNGKKCQGLFSGDTIVEKEYWGQRALQRAFALHILRMRMRRPFEPLYWFLISKGYKTYLLLSNNFFVHYPRYDKPTPAKIRGVMDGFYGGQYPENYDKSTGLIRFEGATCRLKQGVAEVSVQLKAANPRINYFENINPEWRQGTELACLAQVTWLNPLYYVGKTLLKRPVLAVFRGLSRLIRNTAGPASAPASAKESGG